MNSNYLKYIKTVDDRNIILNELDLLISSLYKSGQDSFDETIKNKIRSGVGNVILSDINDNPSERENYLKNLKSEISKIEVFRLTIPFEPPQEYINRIYLRIVELVGVIVLEVIYDPKIIAGCITEFKGKYKDFTYLPLIDSYIDKNINSYILK